MKMFSSLVRLTLCIVLLTAGSAGARELYAPQAWSEGELQRLDIGSNSVLINGYQYEVDSSAKVEIGGSFGAFTMLKEGMLVKFTYLQYKDGTRVIKTLSEVRQIDRI